LRAAKKSFSTKKVFLFFFFADVLAPIVAARVAVLAGFLVAAQVVATVATMAFLGHKSFLSL